MTTPKRSAWHIGLALASALVTTVAQAAPAEVQVDFADGRLSLQAEQVPLRSILEAVASAADLEVQLRGELNETLSRSIHAQPLHAAIGRLLDAGGHSFILQLAPQGSNQPSRLLVNAANGSGASVVSLVAADSRKESQDPDGEAIEEAVELLETMSLEQDAVMREAAAEALAELEAFAAKD